MFYLKGLMHWLVDFGHEKSNITIDPNDWKLIRGNEHITPQQENTYDCGVFTSVCADFVSEGLPLEYRQEQMPHYRQKIATDIMRGVFNYPKEALRINSSSSSSSCINLTDSPLKHK